MNYSIPYPIKLTDAEFFYRPQKKHFPADLIVKMIEI